jgi:hypothetical protein
MSNPKSKTHGKVFDKTTGEAVEVKPGRSSFTVEDRVPPFLPINWMDWLGDEHVREMNETMWGVYFAILLELWQYDRIEFDHKVLAARLRCRDPRNVRTFLEKWWHLFRCIHCGGVMQYPRNPHADHTQGSCNPHAKVTQPSCKYCADLTPCSCKGHAGYALNPKLSFYKKDVKNGLPLGTTKPNQIERNRKEANPTNLSAADAAGESVGGSSLTGGAGKDQEVEHLEESLRDFDAVDSEQGSRSMDGAILPTPDLNPAPASTPSIELTDLRQWNEDRFGFSATRLRNCLIYVLDHCDWWTSEITLASMERESLVRKLNEVTPLDWKPDAPQPGNKKKIYLRGDPACRTCGGSGRVEDYDVNIIGARPSLPCPDCQCSWQLPLGGGEWQVVPEEDISKYEKFV